MVLKGNGGVPGGPPLSGIVQATGAFVEAGTDPLQFFASSAFSYSGTAALAFTALHGSLLYSGPDVDALITVGVSLRESGGNPDTEYLGIAHNGDLVGVALGAPATFAAGVSSALLDGNPSGYIYLASTRRVALSDADQIAAVIGQTLADGLPSVEQFTMSVLLL